MGPRRPRSWRGRGGSRGRRRGPAGAPTNGGRGPQGLAVARGLAETLAGTGVTVNSVLPGPTASEGVTTFVSQMAAARGVDFATAEREFFSTARPSSILQRFAIPDECAAMITYLCSTV